MDEGFRSKYRLTKPLLVIHFVTKKMVKSNCACFHVAKLNWSNRGGHKSDLIASYLLNKRYFLENEMISIIKYIKNNIKCWIRYKTYDNI